MTGARLAQAMAVPYSARLAATLPQ